jgi:anti-anti-sigma factor
MKDDFSVTLTLRGGCRVLVAEGELDMVTVPQLDAALDASADGVPVIVDLSGLTFMESGGLHALLRERNGGRPSAIVRAPASNVGRLLDIVDVRKAIPVYDDMPEAIGQLGRDS